LVDGRRSDDLGLSIRTLNDDTRALRVNESGLDAIAHDLAGKRVRGLIPYMYELNRDWIAFVAKPQTTRIV
jgi:hypothetical protein